MPVRMVSAMIASLLSGVVQPACLWAVAQAHADAPEASMVRRARGIIRCLLNGLRSIVAGFVWRVEGGGRAALPLCRCMRFPNRPPRRQEFSILWRQADAGEVVIPTFHRF